MGLSQKDFAKLGGVTLNTQHRYESGTLPPIDYLLRIGEAGSDWFWIVTGQRIGDALSLQESSFLDAIRVLDEIGRQALLVCAQRMAGLGSNLAGSPSSTDSIRAELHDEQVAPREGK